MNPNSPIYIVSKGRFEKRLTARSLERMGVPYHIVVEEQERADYAKYIDSKKILVLDPNYQDDYDTCDDLGRTKGVGPGAARNFVWDHAISTGSRWHWVMDDNIDGFCRYTRNSKIKVLDGTIFRCMEDFCDRYNNLIMAGPAYRFFVSQRSVLPPVVFNTRIYSCNLIRNDVPYRWRGRYNEDTDLSLRMLKDGWCTAQFNAFLQNKIGTQQIKGGNTAEFYEREGTLPKSLMQVRLHPDVSRLVKRWGRWHHYVDYRPFKKNKLVKRLGVEIPNDSYEYGMTLVNL